MATLQEFLIPKRTLTLINKKGQTACSYLLGHWSLTIQNIIYLEFATKEKPNGIDNLINRLSNSDPMACLKAIYILIEDKTDIPVFTDFTKKLDKYNIPLHEIQILLTKIISESIPKYRKKKIIIKIALIILAMMIFAGLLFMI